MNLFLESSLKAKSDARRDWQDASMEEKIQALIQMQRLARNMAEAANRPFKGVVWGESVDSGPALEPRDKGKGKETFAGHAGSRG